MNQDISQNLLSLVKMESGIIFASSSDSIGLFTRIFCEYSYIGVYLHTDHNYVVTLINPYLLIEPRTYYVNHIKELYEMSSEDIHAIYIKKCNLTSPYDGKLDFEGLLTKRNDFVHVVTTLISNEQVGVEAINDLFCRLHPNFTFDCSSIKEYEERDDIFGQSIKILSFYSDKKIYRDQLPRTLEGILIFKVR